MSDEPKPNRPKQAKRLIEAGWLALALLIAIGARFYFLPAPSTIYPGINGAPVSSNQSPPPSMDELWHLVLTTGLGDYYATLPGNTLIRDVPPMTGLTAARPWYTVWTSMDYVAHPPLYVTTLRLWRNLFGQSDMAAVSYSIIWSCITVALVYLIVRLECTPIIAFLAAVTIGFSAPQIYFAIEIRGYAMLTGLILGLIYVTMILCKSGVTISRLICFSALLLLAMLTHYLALPTCIACGLVAFWQSPKIERLKVIIAGAIAGVIFIAAWAPFLYSQAQHIEHVEESYLGNPDGIWTLIKIASVMPLRIIGDTWDFSSSLITGAGAIVFAMLLFMGFKQKCSWVIIFCFTFSFGWIVLSDLYHHTKLISFIRYDAPLLALLVPGLFITFFNRQRQHPTIIAMVVIGLGMIGTPLVSQQSFPITYDSPMLYPQAHSAALRMKENETIVIACTDLNQCRWMALELSHIPGLFPRDIVLIDQPLKAELILECRTETAWLISMDSHTNDFWLPGQTIVQHSPSACHFKINR